MELIDGYGSKEPKNEEPRKESDPTDENIASACLFCGRLSSDLSLGGGSGVGGVYVNGENNLQKFVTYLSNIRQQLGKFKFCNDFASTEGLKKKVKRHWLCGESSCLCSMFTDFKKNGCKTVPQKYLSIDESNNSEDKEGE
jgi:hypothetical protein